MTTTSTSRTPPECVVCSSEGTGFRVELMGEIDLLARPRLNQVLDDITAAPPGDVFIDLTAVSFLGSEALSFFAALHAHAAPQHRVVLHGPNRSARRSLELTGFDQVLTIVAAGEEVPEATGETPVANPGTSGR